MTDILPVPAQLVAQLDKCKTVRKGDYYKSREKTAKVCVLVVVVVQT